MSTWEQLPVEPWITEVTGEPDKISVGSRRNIWGVNSKTRTIYQWKERVGVWRRSSGMLSSMIAAAADNSAWCVDTDGNLHKFENQTWTRTTISRPDILQLAAGSATDLWSIYQGQAHSVVCTYDFKNQVWIGKGHDMKWVSVAEDGTVWGINKQAKIVEYDRTEDDWININGPKGKSFAQVSVINKDSAWALDTEGTLYWHPPNHWWIQAGFFATVAGGSDQTAWAINTARQICNYRRCPPHNITALKLSVSSESVNNYATLEANAPSEKDDPKWGLTGLYRYRPDSLPVGQRNLELDSLTALRRIQLSKNSGGWRQYLGHRFE